MTNENEYREWWHEERERRMGVEAKLDAIERTRKNTKGEPQALVDGLACLLGEPNGAPKGSVDDD